MAKLWLKGSKKLHPVVEKYTAGTDHEFDMEILPFDLEASIAHVKGLAKIGILNKAELAKIISAFASLKRDFEKGAITITPEDEDCHTVIENYVIGKIGDAGKKIHTGRSRNDQVAVA